MKYDKNYKPDFKWPVAVARNINAPAEQIWQVISTPGNLEVCHPFCASNPVEVWPGPDSRDVIHYLSGWIMERRFTTWIDGVGYDLEIGRKGGRTSFVSWRVKAINPENSRLLITIYPHALQNVPLVVRWLPHFLYLGPQLKKYLMSVTGGFEWYLKYNESVPRNQFGSHPWFSIPDPG